MGCEPCKKRKEAAEKRKQKEKDKKMASNERTSISIYSVSIPYDDYYGNKFMSFNDYI